MKSASHHADNLCRNVIKVQLLADDVRITGETTLPESMTDHTNKVLAFRVFTFDKRTTEHRIDAENFEEVGSDTRHRQTFRLAIAREIDRAAVKESDRFERTILFAIRSKVRLRNSPRVESQLRARLNQSHHAVRITKRQRSQQNAVHQAEDRGVGANAERESDDCNQSECRVASRGFVRRSEGPGIVCS